MKVLKIVYWIATAVLSLLMLFAAFNYLFKYPVIADVFVKLGYPTYLIFPLAIAKIFGVIAILTRKSKTLTEWAYAGFFFNFMLALSAHLNAGDGQFAPSIVCLILLMISYASGKKVYG